MNLMPAVVTVPGIATTTRIRRRAVVTAMIGKKNAIDDRTMRTHDIKDMVTPIRKRDIDGMTIPIRKIDIDDMRTVKIENTDEVGTITDTPMMITLKVGVGLRQIVTIRIASIQGNDITTVIMIEIGVHRRDGKYSIQNLYPFRFAFGWEDEPFLNERTECF